MRRQEEDARAATLGLAAATAESPPSPGPSNTRHVVLRVAAPDHSTYEVRGQGYFVPQFTFSAPAYDDGTHGDERKDDGVYTATIEVPLYVPTVEYLFYRDGEPELRPLPPMASTVGDRLLTVPADTIGPVHAFGSLLYMAERAHPNREGQSIIAGLIADRLATFPSFQRFVGAAGS